MTSDELKILWSAIGGLTALAVTTICFGVAWYRSRRGLMAQLLAEVRSLNARVDQITESTDTVALEVERLGEGQRYTAKLLSQAQMPSAASKEGRVITPH